MRLRGAGPLASPLPRPIQSRPPLSLGLGYPGRVTQHVARVGGGDGCSPEKLEGKGPDPTLEVPLLSRGDRERLSGLKRPSSCCAGHWTGLRLGTVPVEDGWGGGFPGIRRRIGASWTSLLWPLPNRVGWAGGGGDWEKASLLNEGLLKKRAAWWTSGGLDSV